VTNVGFIGLGSQGGPMARRLAEGGFPLTLWARRRASLDAYADVAVTIAETPAELGAASEIVGICVVADTDVTDVVLGDDGVLAGMAPGGVIAIHSTVHPDTCRELAVLAESAGVAVVDAPVSGGGGAATEGKLLVMVGGADDVVVRCGPVFATFGDPVVHVGALGNGQMAKALNNLVFTAQITIAVETFAFADELGMDRAAVAQVLAHGSGASRAAGILAASGFNLSGIRTAAPLLDKDVGIALDVARAHEVSEPTNLAVLARQTLATLRPE
jgi:3-hydroxyisobutyrate dehydrogenase